MEIVEDGVYKMRCESREQNGHKIVIIDAGPEAMKDDDIVTNFHDGITFFGEYVRDYLGFKGVVLDYTGMPYFGSIAEIHGMDLNHIGLPYRMVGVATLPEDTDHRTVMPNVDWDLSTIKPYFAASVDEAVDSLFAELEHKNQQKGD